MGRNKCENEANTAYGRLFRIILVQGPHSDPL
jgi:hypothetical protein